MVAESPHAVVHIVCLYLLISSEVQPKTRKELDVKFKSKFSMCGKQDSTLLSNVCFFDNKLDDTRLKRVI